VLNLKKGKFYIYGKEIKKIMIQTRRKFLKTLGGIALAFSTGIATSSCINNLKCDLGQVGDWNLELEIDNSNELKRGTVHTLTFDPFNEGKYFRISDYGTSLNSLNADSREEFEVEVLWGTSETCIYHRKELEHIGLLGQLRDILDSAYFSKRAGEYDFLEHYKNTSFSVDSQNPIKSLKHTLYWLDCANHSPELERQLEDLRK